MKSLRAHALILLLAAGVLAPELAAHPDDPKILDRMPVYEGPGYRRGAGVLQAHGGIDHSFGADGITLWSWLTLSEIDSRITSGNDCWGYASPSSREYAIMGHSHGTVFVEVTQPGNATVIANIDGPNSTWRDIKTYGSYAYVVSEGGGGIQVFDLSGIDEGLVELVNTVMVGGTAASHNLAINEDSGFLYRLGGGNNGMRIYDLVDPANPEYVGAWSNRYIHDAHIVTMVRGPWAGREIAFACSGYNGGRVETGLDILDLTDKNDIKSLSRMVYPDGEYSHQAWLSADRQLLYLDDELDEQNQGINTNTRIFDVSDLDNPTLAGSFSSGTASIDHNLYVVGDLIYEANYRSGLRIFDARDPLNPTPLAHFDTFPNNDANRFNGLWSNYPFLPSGTILGSDIERGLFVWRLGEAPVIVTPGGPFEPGAGLGTTAPGGELELGTELQRLVGLGDSVGPSPVVINEIAWMGTQSAPGAEWMELLNTSATSINLSGWTLSDGTGRARVPLSGTLAPGELMVLAIASQQALPCLPTTQRYAVSLTESATGLLLRDATGRIVDEVSTWHAGDDASAATMSRIDPLAAGDSPTNWWSSTASYCGVGRGSPGELDPAALAPCSGAEAGVELQAGLRVDGFLAAAGPSAREWTLADRLAATRSSILLALSTPLADGPAFEALLQAETRGVSVRCLVANEAARLPEPSTTTCRIASGAGSMAHDFIVMDEETTWTGNPADTANGLLVESTDLSRWFGTEFDEMTVAGRLQRQKRDDAEHVLCYRDGSRIEAYFSPSDAALGKGVLPALRRSTRSIDLRLPTELRPGRVQQELMAAAERGVSVRLLVPASVLAPRLASTLRAAGITLRQVESDGTRGSGAIVDDELAILGSTGWNDDDDLRNDGSSLLLWRETLARHLSADFQGRWEASRELPGYTVPPPASRNRVERRH